MTFSESESESMIFNSVNPKKFLILYKLNLISTKKD